ncbi:transposase [Nitrincola sp.]|uniref:transposase n=1 Tax=Nitrincola sp. TaxID=1926584 RepID=UPI003A90D679
MQLEAHTMQYLLSVGAQLETAGHGQRGELISQAASALNYSEHWIRDRLKDLGFSKSRKERCDRGQSSVNRDECIQISNLIMQASRDNGKQLMSLKQAIQIASANGLIGAGVSESTVSREMRRHRVHPEQMNKPKPHKQVRSLHPNHVWQFDVSVCVLYYLPKSEGLKVMPRDEFYKNKLENVYRIKNDRVLRYLITDHYSSAFYVEYFNTPGENSETLVQFLLNAFSQRDDDPVQGVPFMLVWDAGTANQSHLVKGMLDRLQVKHHAHEVGSPRAKGQVERTHNLVECEFESRLSMRRIDTIEELNEKAQQWAQMYNGTQLHRRHGHTRYGMWQTIRTEQLRICPPRELCLSLLQKARPVSRIVAGDLTISYAIAGIGSHTYSVRCIPDVCIGDKVQVTYNPYQAPNVTVIHENLDGQKIHYELEPIERDAAGFEVDAPVFGQNYAAVRDTPVDELRKQMNREAYGVETDQAVKEARKARKPAFDGQVDPFADVNAAVVPAFMRRKGQALGVLQPTRALEIRLPYVKAVPMIRDTIGLLPGSEEFKQLTREFKRRFPDGMPEECLMEFTGEMVQLFGMTDEPISAEVGK